MKPNTTRFRFVLTLLWIVAGLLALSIVPDYFRYKFITSLLEGTPDPAYAPSYKIVLFDVSLNLLRLAASVGLSVAFICWFRRAYYNLHRLTDKLSFGEGWAAAAWFVPFVNLLLPFRIMKEMTEEAQDLLVERNLTRYNDAVVRRVSIWWTFGIIYFVVTGFIIRAELMGPTLETSAELAVANIVMNFFGIVLTLVTIKMVSAYAKMEVLLPLVQQGEGRPVVLDDSDILDSI